ncbi:MAG: extracellular solute-binding protein, partial [Clostridia bacterium]|nr:extracellular solute-binding protein [Clostridia bacterium]
MLLSLAFLTPVLLSFSGCASDRDVTLRVYNWEEYIDEGGKGSYDYDFAEEGEVADTRPILDKFEQWYKDTYHKSVRVEYSTFGTNEDLYNQLKLGDKYDLVCPSEYMIMKLAAEGMIQPLDERFFDETIENNYYINNVSPFIREKFDEGKMTVKDQEEPQSWSKYAAGYMWGVTGLVYNPAQVGKTALQESGWSIMLDSAYKNKVTTKDNVRDSYFVGLGILYREDLLKLKEQNENGELSDEDYTKQVTAIMNDVKPETVEKVTKILKDMKSNIFGFETDTGKSDMVKGTISMNFAWSGDAVYALDEADKQNVELNFYIPEECANLFFDGWVMPKDEKRNKDTEQAALAFINFMSRPDNAVRNSYYIGYTSVIAGNDNPDDEFSDYMLEYIKETYDEGKGEDYDLSYFFGEGAVIKTKEEHRQLYAQYPPSDTVKRCAVMNYYGDEEEAINELWTQIKGEQLSAWAIVVICVAVVAIVLFVVFSKFGHKIEFRLKPKKGYKLVKQEKLK